MIRLAIVEDDDRQAALMCRYTGKYASDNQMEIVAEWFKNGLLFLEAYRGNYDAVLLDIAMPVMNGMECAKKLRARDERVQIVFITSMAQYAIHGYEVEAAAFMVKPVQYTEFAVKMERILRRIQSRQENLYVIALKNETMVVDINDILYVEVFGHYLIFHTKNGISKVYGKLSAVEEDERFRNFIKVSPSHLVNCRHVAHVGKDTLTVAGDQLPLSRRRRNECLQKMARVIGGGLI